MTKSIHRKFIVRGTSRFKNDIGQCFADIYKFGGITLSCPACGGSVEKWTNKEGEGVRIRLDHWDTPDRFLGATVEITIIPRKKR